MADVDRASPYVDRTVETIPDRDRRIGLDSIRHEFRQVASRHPSLFLPLARRRHPQSTLGPDTQIVVDGFTRSAGTFALTAFQVAQNGHVRAAHHLHASAHLKAAVRAGVPTLVPIRPPRDTVLSASIREPDVGLERWLRSYRDFYLDVLPLAEGVVFARFDSVTGDLGAVTRRVNDRFGTTFAEFEHSGDDLDIVVGLIEERAARPVWQWQLGEFLAGRVSLDEYRALTEDQRRTIPMPEIPEERVQRPSAARSEAKARLAARYDAPGLERMRRRAKSAYEAVAASAC